MRWTPRRTIAVIANSGRRLRSDGFIYSDAVRESYGGLSLRGAVTNALSLNLDASATRQRYAYDIQAPTPIAPRTDRSRLLRAQLTYAASSRLAFTMEGRHDRRRSTDARFDYSDNAAGISVRYQFGPPLPGD